MPLVQQEALLQKVAVLVPARLDLSPIAPRSSCMSSAEFDASPAEGTVECRDTVITRCVVMGNFRRSHSVPPVAAMDDMITRLHKTARLRRRSCHPML